MRFRHRSEAAVENSRELLDHYRVARLLFEDLRQSPAPIVVGMKTTPARPCLDYLPS
jgi:hypothetical protein